MIEINTIVFAGCGALGSLIAYHLNTPDTIEYILIDDDVVEEVNVGTSIYEKIQVGIPKVQALGTLLYRRNRRKCRALRKTVKEPLIYASRVTLVVDTFDNPKARNMTKGDGFRTCDILHCGVSPDLTGSILWDEVCPPFEVEFERGESRFCTRQVGAQILRLTAVHSCNIIEAYLATGQKLNKGVTLR